jgi:hypothetical protein
MYEAAMGLKKRASFARGADRAAEAGRAIQRKIDRKDRARGQPSKKTGAMQAGARSYPEIPRPKQHLKKPGKETVLELQPMYDAPLSGIGKT